MNILITGIAGTIGKEFARLLKGEHKVRGIDNNEWAVAEFKEEFPGVSIQLGDFYNSSVDKADVVIHCAAYKHVNIGETDVVSFIENNVTDTRELFSTTYKNGAKILFISTDKAVEPSSVYGYTKALGEALCKQYGGQIARFGNILNSNGSVIPIWEQAIKDKKPIKITDWKMKRYVLEAQDAVRMVWEGFLAGKDLIIPECEELTLEELLDRVLKKHKLTRADVEIEIIGKRAGEKMREKLRWDEEEAIEKAGPYKEV